MIEQLTTRLMRYGIAKQHASDIVARGTVGQTGKRIWIEVAGRDEQDVGGLKRIEMMA